MPLSIPSNRTVLFLYMEWGRPTQRYDGRLRISSRRSGQRDVHCSSWRHPALGSFRDPREAKHEPNCVALHTTPRLFRAYLATQLRNGWLWAPKVESRYRLSVSRFPPVLYFLFLVLKKTFSYIFVDNTSSAEVVDLTFSEIQSLGVGSTVGSLCRTIDGDWSVPVEWSGGHSIRVALSILHTLSLA